MITEKLIPNIEKYSVTPVDLVWTENNSFDIKWPENQFFILVHMVCLVLTRWHGFDRKWQFWPKTAWNSFFTPVDIIWPVLPGGIDFHRKWQFWSEMAWNSFFVLIDMVWLVLTKWTRFLWKKGGWLKKNIFFIFKLSFNFFCGFFWIKIEIK